MGTSVPSVRQHKKFISDVIGDNALETVVDWVSENMEPEDVFDKDVLEIWAKQNGFTEEI